MKNILLACGSDWWHLMENLKRDHKIDVTIEKFEDSKQNLDELPQKQFDHFLVFDPFGWFGDGAYAALDALTDDQCKKSFFFHSFASDQKLIKRAESKGMNVQCFTGMRAAESIKLFLEILGKID